MLDDARLLHEKLLQCGCRSKLHIAPERWHAYVLYCLEENMAEDFQAIDHFLTKNLSPAQSLRWMRLDNAAKIYPAAKRRNWNNFFRLSATLTETVDVAVLRSALDVTVRRFPLHRCAAAAGRVLVLSGRDPPHAAYSGGKAARWPMCPFRRCGAAPSACWCTATASPWSSSTPLTDGTGGLIFLKTLVAEYLTQKYGVAIPRKTGCWAGWRSRTPRSWRTASCTMPVTSPPAARRPPPTTSAARRSGMATKTSLP